VDLQPAPEGIHNYTWKWNLRPAIEIFWWI